MSMVYFIRAKKEIKEAILKILNKEREVSLQMLVANLKLDTGLTERLIIDIIKDLKITKRIKINNGTIQRWDQGVDEHGKEIQD